MQFLAVTEVEKRIRHVVGDDVLFPRPRVTRKHGEINFVTVEAMFKAAVKGKEGGVIVGGVGGTLLEINREQREAVVLGVIRIFSAGETEQLENLPAVFRAE